MLMWICGSLDLMKCWHCKESLSTSWIQLAVSIIKSEHIVRHVPFIMAPLFSYFLKREQQRLITGLKSIVVEAMDWKFPASIVCMLYGPKTYMTRTYRTNSNLTDVSNYSDNFVNYFLTSNCTVHSKILELVVL